MATIKLYTDIEQSRKLAEILPLESADMLWEQHGAEPYVTIKPWTTVGKSIGCHCLGCWSLAALLDVLSKWAECVNEAGIVELSYEKVTKWCVSMLNCGKIKDCYTDNPVDACVAMIEKLHELNLL